LESGNDTLKKDLDKLRLSIAKAPRCRGRHTLPILSIHRKKGSTPMMPDPLQTPKSEYAPIIERISVADSPVGIDAQYTHAIIITYLQQIAERLARLEARLDAGDPVK
jgi:hypothetical protein